MIKRYLPQENPPIRTKNKEYKRRADNKQRARKKLTRLIHANIPLKPIKNQKPRFYLLTYADQNYGQYKNHRQHMQDLARFTRKLRKEYPGADVRYIGVKEKTKKGVAHFHVIFPSLPFIEKEKLEKMWGKGFVKIKMMNYGYDNIKHIANYCGKYITKDIDELGKYDNCYFVSENLTQPLETIHSKQIRDILLEAVEKRYIITRSNKEYQMEYINNAVTYEVWEPV
jgi:hypothetical protein